ncbi:MAG TPA: SH3 domain-containing protein, partial [Candidatus Limnocylindrales bacterium]|nr:SH3 domain-containing protein [Candidatus Limnocylindrales bacterium]
DRVATMYNKIGAVHGGDRVEVLEKQRRFLRVRTDSGQEGWIEERSLVPQAVYDAFQKLASDNASQQVQAHGTARSELNMHVTPAREGEHLYQLKDGEKVEVLKRATAEKNPPKSASANATQSPKSAATTPPQSKTAPVPAKPPPSAKAGSAPGKPPAPPKPVMEDWYLVRNSAGRVGWVLLRMIDLDIPLEVAQYAEGQRIMGYFVLNTVQEEDKQVPQYLVLLNEPKDGLPWDFNQIRIFTRNRAKHRYETAYRERNLEGYFPVKTGHQDFGKEGDLPTFTIRKKTDDGQMVDITYKLNGPIVRRVLTPEEEAAEKTKHEAALAAYYAQRKKQPPAHPQPHHKHK